MLQGFKYRLYPTKGQAELIDKTIGCCRLIYNIALDLKQYCYKAYGVNLSAYDLFNQLPEMKQGCEWLKEVDSQTLQQSILDMCDAYKNFFKGAGYPSFKRKTNGGSFRNPHGLRVEIFANKIHCPKFTKGIKIVIDRPHIGVIRSSTISKTPTGKYYVSILCETGIKAPIPSTIQPDKAIGIDIGLSHFAILSDGTKIENPRHLKNSIERLGVLQRRMRNKKKGSANTKKAYRRIALLHERVADQRQDFLHKITSKLTDENQVLCVEDLNIRGMVKNRRLSRAISDAGWGTFGTMLRYKAERKGVTVLTVPMFQASTKPCSCCRQANNYLTLADREWDCDFCGTHHDRDVNAAINIKEFCLKNTGMVTPVEPVEARTVVRPTKQECKKPVIQVSI